MVTLEQAPAHEWWAALEFAFAEHTEPDRRRHVLNALALLASGALDPGGLWVARSGGQIVGVQLCALLDGASCLFWPPVVQRTGTPAGLAAELTAAGLRWSRARGCKLAQALLLPAEEEQAAPLVEAGFRRITELLAMQHDLRRLPSASPQSKLRWRQAHEAGDLFQQTLLRTYAGTRDCPELNGVRTVAEIVAGHRGAGKVRPDLWWLVAADGRPAGVLLLTELTHGLDWDLSYVGVVPEYRRHGLGRALTIHALHAAREGGALSLLLAVDARNAPARTLYTALGFVETSTRLVYLHFFEEMGHNRG